MTHGFDHATYVTNSSEKARLLKVPKAVEKNGAEDRAACYICHVIRLGYGKSFVSSWPR